MTDLEKAKMDFYRQGLETDCDECVLSEDDQVFQFTLTLHDQLIGRLQFASSNWTYVYADAYKNRVLAGKAKPIIGFPHIDEQYASPSLWPFFQIRLPGRYIERELGGQKLSEAELLARFGQKSIANPYIVNHIQPKTAGIPAVSVTYGRNSSSAKPNELGMRAMQERAYERRGEQYLLIKSPPASGKSRALMFIALDKLKNQGLKRVIIAVPERSIGASFHNEPLSKFGFWADWEVEPRWNLCDAAGTDGGKVDAVGEFLSSGDQILVCTHATFRFAVERFGVEGFDESLIAIDEFHHVSANPNNVLGEHLRTLIERDKTHIVAMTGSYFRGDAEAVLMPEDESKFTPVTYTYYEQLNGYEHLKQLDISYYFYAGSYLDEVMSVLRPHEKTILHIPNVNSRESSKQKYKEVEDILSALGEWEGTDQATGFQLVRTSEGQLLRIADLVEDDKLKRNKVDAALGDSSQKYNRDHVDIIIALGKAKEGFDWIWCEHALTVGYRSSLTEIVQIIGRATRDAPGKSKARFTNLIAEPDASESAVTEAINDTLKAIAASLLMEQVLTPQFEFRPKNPQNLASEGYDYGDDGYKPDGKSVGVNTHTGAIQIEIAGLAVPKTDEVKRICSEDLQEIVTAFVQDTETVKRGLFDKDIIAEELTQVRMGKIIKNKYANLDTDDVETVRQHAVAAMNLLQKAKEYGPSIMGDSGSEEPGYGADAEAKASDGGGSANTALLQGIRRFAQDVRELDMDLIDSVNPFGEAYNILAKTMDEDRLREVEAIIAAKRVKLDLEEATALAVRAFRFKEERGRLPKLNSPDPFEKLIAEGVEFLRRAAIQQQANG
ncbi:MAG: DEAD/DEAH box helicase [Saprospiraceae bacterium]